MIFQDFGVHRDTDLPLNIVLKSDYQAQKFDWFLKMSARGLFPEEGEERWVWLLVFINK